MADLRTQRSLILIKSGATLPIATDFLETTEALIPNPKPTTEVVKRLGGQLGEREVIADTCRVVLDGASISHTVRKTGADFTIQPEWGEVMKVAGFDETYDATVGQESYTYVNSQNQTRGSMIHYLDGKKQEFTDTIVATPTMTFEIGKQGVFQFDLSGFYDSAEAVDEANPAVTKSTESAMIVSCADIFLDGADSLTAKTITIRKSNENKENYGFNRKDYTTTDYQLEVDVTFMLDSADYNKAITRLQNGTSSALDIKLGTNKTGTLINGESMHITAPLAQVLNFDDADAEGTIERTITFLLNPNGSGEGLSIKVGFFA